MQSQIFLRKPILTIQQAGLRRVTVRVRGEICSVAIDTTSSRLDDVQSSKRATDEESMRTRVKTFLLVVFAGLLPSAAWAQVTLAGAVKDASGALLPGVTVEASSPVLIEKTRTATTDGAGQYRIESLQPGTYTVTFSLLGFATLKRDDVLLSGTGVVKIDAEMKVGGLAETVTVTAASPIVDVQSTTREVTLDNETMRSLPAVRSYSYLLTGVPGLQANITDVNTGPVFAIFPVHGGRGVESRLTIEGLNI